MQKHFGGAKPARIVITLTAICSMVLAMLVAGTSAATAIGESQNETSAAASVVEPKKADLDEGLKGEITTQGEAFAGDDIKVEFKDVANDTKVDLWMFSTPTKLGTKAVEDGAVEVTVPADATLGEHTLAAYGEDGEQLGWTPFTVVEKPAAKSAAKNDAPPAATPMASSTSTDIVITARTFASSAGIGTNTADTNGASYKLYTTSAFTTEVPGTSGCTVTGGTGKCTINVPNTNSGGANYNKQYYVKQVAAPNGTFANPELTLGDSSLSASSLFSWAVPGQTKALKANDVQNLPFNASDVPSNGNNVPSNKRQSSAQRGSYGAVPYSKDNPSLVTKCGQGLKIAMVLDLSGSTAGFKEQYKKAITGTGGFFDGLTGTGSSVASFTFGNKSPASGSSNFSDLKSIDTQRTALNSQVNGQINSISSNSYTNWESGLLAAKDAGQFNSYDYVLFVTDGAPNTVGNDSKPDGSNISVRALEAGIYAANSIKAAGKPVISVAVGNGVNKAEADVNLRAISGETQNKDYFKGNWDELNKILVKQAQEVTCGATVVATKEIPNGQGGWKADAGWDMTIGVQSSDSVTKTPAAATRATDSDGDTGWNLQFTQPNATADVTITETQKTNWEFKEGFCKVGDKTISVDSETATIPGVKRGDRVECTFRNAEIPASWTLTKSSNPGSGATVTPGQEIEYTVTASNPSKAAVNNVVVNDDLAGVLASNADLISGPTATQGTATITNNKLTWNVGTLAANSSKTVTYKVKVKSDALGKTIKNVVTGTGQVPPNPCPTDNQKCRETEHFTPKWTLAKSSNPATGTKVVPGQKIIYTLTATNSSNAAVANVVVNDNLANVLNNAALTSGPTTATGLATVVGNQLTWTIPSLAANSTATVTYEVTVNADAAGVTIGNVVSGDGAVPPTTCTAAQPCSTTHNTDPNWTLAKTSNPASGTKVVPGQEIEYTVTATNGSKSAVNGVVVTDNLASVLNNATLVGTPNASIGTANVSGNTLTWNAGSLAAGQTATVTYKVKIKDNAYGVTVKNVVTGNGSVPPAQCTTAKPCETTHTTNPVWSLAKTSDPASGTKVTPGQEITYTVKATNPSGAAVAGVVVNDDLTNVLNNATLVGSPSASVGSASITDSTLKWTVGSLAANSNATVTYKVKVKADAYGVTIGNVVTGNGAVPPTTCAEGNPCTTTHPTDPTWSLAKTSDPASGTKVTPGQDITYTVTAKNPSKSAVTGVVVRDDLSNVLNHSAMVGVPVTANGTANVVANQLVWENVTLAPNSESTLTYTVKVNDNAHGVTIGNVVTGNGSVPPTTCTEAEPCTTTHDTDPVWSLAKTSNPESGTKVTPGSKITYTLTATNSSGKAVNNVVVTDNLTNVLNNAAVTAGPTTATGTAGVSGNTLTWTIGSLAANSTATVTYEVTVNADAFGVSIGNSVTGNGSVPPSTCAQGNPCTTTHPTDPTWTLAKTSDPATGTKVTPGQEITYTVKANNPSKSAVAGVVVTDDLTNVLNNATLVGTPNASVGTPVVDGNTLTWTVGSLPKGESTLTYKVKVNTDAVGVSIGNVVTGNGDVPPTKCTTDNPCTTTHETDPAWSLAKTSNPASGTKVVPGQEIEYTVTATNGSKGAVQNIVVNDNLAQVLNNATLVDGSIDASVGSADISGNTLTWNVGELAAGATATVKYRVTVNEDALGVTIGNVVSGNGSIPPVACTTQQPCETTHTTDPTWSLAKTSNPASGTTVVPDQVITYTVTANNPSKSSIKGVVVTDNLTNVLNNAALVDGSINASVGTASVSGNTLTWTVGELAANSTPTVTYQVKVNADAYGVTIGNVVSGKSGDGQVPPTSCTEQQPCTTTHDTDPVWSLAKTSDPASGTKVTTGQEITYTVKATNPSGKAVTGVVVNDDLSNVLNNSTLVGLPVASTGNANVVGNQLVWDNVTLAPKSESTLTYKVKVNDNAHGVTIGNVVTGNGDVPPTTCTEAKPCTTTHDTDPTWSLAKISDPVTNSTVLPGQEIEYTVTATNPSGKAVTGVVVTDNLANVLNNATLIEGPTTATGSADVSGSTLTWTIGSLAANSEAKVTYKVKVNDEAYGVTIGNVVSGKSGDGQVPPTSCTEQQPCSTTHDTDPVWTMDKTSNPASGTQVQPGSKITYTVTATNKSQRAIDNVVINDNLSNVLNNSVLTEGPTASTGDVTQDGNALKWTIPSLAADTTETVTYTVTVNANANGVTINNTVFGTSGEGEGILPPEKCTEEAPCDTTHNTPPVESPTGPTSPAVTPTDGPNGPTDPAVTPTDGGNTDDQGVLPHTGAGLTVMVGLLALILIGGGLVLRYASRQRKH